MAPLFSKYPHDENDHLLTEMNNNHDFVQNELSDLCCCLKEVVEKQLNDFILDGK